MFNCYEVETTMQERYRDLLREGEEERLARMAAPGQRRQRESLLQALTRQVKAIVWGAQAQRSFRPA